jgi:DNA-binding transcriptional MocR family regulator
VDLLIRSEVPPGQPVAVEDPTFPGALDALHRAGAGVIGIPAGHGVDPERLEHAVRTHRPAMVYLIPTHHNPTGLRARYDALAGALRASLPGWTWPEPDGGLCLWARLPGEADSSAFAQAALRHGVALVPGRLLSAHSGANSFVRLAFTQPPDVLRAAIRQLAAIPGPSRLNTPPSSAPAGTGPNPV